MSELVETLERVNGKPVTSYAVAKGELKGVTLVVTRCGDGYTYANYTLKLPREFDDLRDSLMRSKIPTCRYMLPYDLIRKFEALTAERGYALGSDTGSLTIYLLNIKDLNFALRKMRKDLSAVRRAFNDMLLKIHRRHEQIKSYGDWIPSRLTL